MGIGNIGLPGLIAIAVLLINPFAFWRVLPRAGMPSWLAILTVIPVIAMIMFWIMAFKKWPGDNA